MRSYETKKENVKLSFEALALLRLIKGLDAATTKEEEEAEFEEFPFLDTEK